MGNTGSIILMVVVVVLLVAMFVIIYMRRKKYNSELNSMREELKIGDKVMTDTGVVGELVDSYEEEGYKYFVLKSGRGNNVGCFAVHANAIYYVFGKEDKNVASKQKVEPASNDMNNTESGTTDAGENVKPKSKAKSKNQ